MTSERLPDGWEAASLGDVTERAAKVDPAQQGRSTFRYIDIGSIEAGAYRVGKLKPIPVESAPQRARQLVRAGDTVFSTVRPYLRKIAYIDSSLDGEIASTGFCVLRPSAALDARYLFYLTQWDRFVNRVCAEQRGVNYPAVRERDLLRISIPIPPLAEQARIALALDDHVSRLESANASVARARRVLKAWESSYLLAVTVDSSNVDDWDCKTIADLAKVSTGATPARSRADYHDGGTIPWVTSSLLNQPFVDRADKFITEKALTETSVKIFPAGTLLVAMYGEGQTRGRCSELRIDATTNQACAAIQVREEFNHLAPWIKLVLEATYDRNRRLAAGGVQPNLNLRMVREIKIPIPGDSEMTSILAEVDRQRSLARALESQLAKAAQKGDAMRRSLLSAAFNGDLVSQDPNDENASALLKHLASQRTASVKPRRPQRASSKTAIESPTAIKEELPL